jgi:hypothetical protein
VARGARLVASQTGRRSGNLLRRQLLESLDYKSVPMLRYSDIVATRDRIAVTTTGGAA